MLEEITDRFGKLPPQAQALFDTHKLRVQAKPYGVIKIDAAPGIINITFRPNPPIEPLRIIELVQKNKQRQAGRQRQAAHREGASRTQGPGAVCAGSVAAAGAARRGRLITASL
jgi:transcription-repair coupling factor (superfamily II helicase)